MVIAELTTVRSELRAEIVRPETTFPAESVALTTTAGVSAVAARAATPEPVVPPAALPIVKIGVATIFATEPKNVTVFVARVVVTPAALVTEIV